MNHLASFLDVALYALLVATVGLIVYKTLELLVPHRIGKPSHAQRLGSTHASISEGMEQLESWMTALAVIASAAPFVGLTGTVMHIIEALRNMNGGAADMSLISGPISTALNATLVGLASAIPAAVAHALFQRKLQVLENSFRRLVPDAPTV